MAKKYKARWLHDDPRVQEYRQFCWDRGIIFYPVVIKGQTSAMKFIPKCKIMFKSADKVKVGTEEWEQTDEMYDKIIDLYEDQYNKLNKEL